MHACNYVRGCSWAYIGRFVAGEMRHLSSKVYGVRVLYVLDEFLDELCKGRQTVGGAMR